MIGKTRHTPVHTAACNSTEKPALKKKELDMDHWKRNLEGISYRKVKEKAFLRFRSHGNRSTLADKSHFASFPGQFISEKEFETIK